MPEVGMFSTWNSHGFFTRKGNVGYFWWSHCPSTLKHEIPIVDMKTKVKRVTWLKTGKPVKFSQKRRMILLKNIPSKNPDRIAGISIFKIEFASKPACFKMGKYVIMP